MNNAPKVGMLILAMVFAFSTAALAKRDGGGHGHGPKEGKTPAGWSKGEKTGWHGESLPPGLAKAKEKNKKKT